MYFEHGEFMYWNNNDDETHVKKYMWKNIV